MLLYIGKGTGAGKRNEPLSMLVEVVMEDKAVVGKYAGEEGKCAVCGKPLIMGKAGDVGRTCAAHMGKLGTYYVALTVAPEEGKYVALSTLCRKGEGMGVSAYYVVKLTGKDGGTLPPVEPVYTVYTWQGRKFCKAEAVGALTKRLAKASK